MGGYAGEIIVCAISLEFAPDRVLLAHFWVARDTASTPSQRHVSRRPSVRTQTACG